jgi:hypothetical protein
MYKSLIEFQSCSSGIFFILTSRLSAIQMAPGSMSVDSRLAVAIDGTALGESSVLIQSAARFPFNRSHVPATDPLAGGNLSFSASSR